MRSVSADAGPGAGWKKVRASVAAAVNTADLEGLLALGCPSDEYAPEIDPLTGLVLRDAVSVEAVAAVWEKWFGPESGAVRSPHDLAQLVEALQAIAREARA